jgi:hypothetical protein
MIEKNMALQELPCCESLLGQKNGQESILVIPKRNISITAINKKISYSTAIFTQL